MALDKEYFDAIHIDVVKKKYYNANKVEAVLQDIRQQALALSEENALLHRQLALLNGQKNEIGDALLSAKTISQQIIMDAQARAEEIVAEARAQSEELQAEAQRREDYAVERVEACFSRIKEQHLASIEALNDEWQDFLCGLYPEEKPKAPDDLSQKVDAIAKEFGIENVAKIPFDPQLALECDRGLVEVYDGHFLDDMTRAVEEQPKKVW